MKNDHLVELEKHYRPCACRSTTPWFSKKPWAQEDPSGHGMIDSKDYRTFYQWDRDKILYSHYFRRLRLKTQIFPEHTSDNLRTRLDHTLEVAQIARHLARQLGLNEDLVDAMSLAHDIGHTPFAHSGERALHKFLLDISGKYINGTERKKPLNLDGFKHNWQGLRVVDELEESYPGRKGLNLTRATRIGILKHTGPRYKDNKGKEIDESCSCDMEKALGFDHNKKRCFLFEAQVVKQADDFAQVIHDLEDAFESQLLDIFECVKNKKDFPLLYACYNGIKIKDKEFENKIKDRSKKDKMSLLRTRITSELIYMLTVDISIHARKALDEWEDECLSAKWGNECLDDLEDKRIQDFNNFVNKEGEFPEIITLSKSDGLLKQYNLLKDTIKSIVVKSERVSRMDGKADYVIRHILDIYLTSPLQVPAFIVDKYGEDIRQWNDRRLVQLESDPKFIRACVDYVAGLSDRYALREYDQLYAAYPRVEL
ncbi:MAG: dNTP triphosphohydrolase [Nitrospirae bacterium]|nr:dNTP triphosphohydrolase [Nitrospirota bacterium]